MTLTLWESLPREQILVPRDALSREIAVPAALPGVVTLSAAERLAARLYADLMALAARVDSAGLGRALVGRPLDDPTPEPLEDDPRLALRLVTADIEQLWRDQLIAAAALALVADAPDTTPLSSPRPASTFASPRPAGRGAGGEDLPAARCLLIYRVHPEPGMADTTDAVGGDPGVHAPELAPGARHASLQLPARLPRARLALLLSWTPAAARRSWVFPRSVYTFQWEPVRAVTLDRDVAAGDDASDTDEWTICRLRRPSVLR